MPKLTGPDEGGSKNEPPEGGRISRKQDQKLVLAQVVLDLLSITEGLLQPGPLPQRVDLRMARWRLLDAYPRLRPSETDLAQALAESDGDGQDY